MRWPVRIAAGGGGSALAAAGVLWFVLLSPFGYAPPAGFVPPAATPGPHAVFVYGTLRYPSIRRLVLGRAGDPAHAVLAGYRRVNLDLEPVPGEQVEGVVLEVSAEELARLDRYERLGVRYARTRVTLADGTDAWVYTRVEP